MPAITLTDNFITGNSGLMARLMSLNVTSDNNNILGLLSAGSTWPYDTPTRNGIISIMKGTVPTNFTSLTGYSSRSNDVLVQWSCNAGQFNSSIANTNPSNISTSFAAASASGTATWFWWVTRDNSRYGPTNTLNEQIIGTVGLPGTGSDLEIPSTSVTSGQLFRLIDLRMQLATSFNY